MNKHALKVNNVQRFLRVWIVLMVFASAGFTTTFANKKLSLGSDEVMLVQQAKKKVVSKILDEMRLPVSGATIIVKGTTRGVITDIDGAFEIEVKTTDILQISFIGYDPLEIPVGKVGQVINLKPKVDELDEVTVVGFAKQKKESVIGAISTVKPASLKVPSSNLTQALGGNIAGIISYQASGEPGQDNANFFVRGVTTFGYSKNPLILIDNIESSTDDLARLSVDDIAAFSIMKDATATAIYGARGANGVILITTKQGKEGKPQLSIRWEGSYSMPTRRIETVDPISYMRYQNEAITTRNPLLPEINSEEKIAATMAGRNSYVYPAVDWYKELFNDYTFNQRATVNLSGGGEVARYYVSAAISDDNGIMKVDKRNNYNSNIDLKRISLRSNTNINVTKTTEFTIRFSANFNDYTGPIDGGNNLYRKAMATSPVMFPMYYAPDNNHADTRHILYGNAGTGTGDYINPYADLMRGYKDYSYSILTAQAELMQKLDFVTPGLFARVIAYTTRDSYFEVRREIAPFYYSVGYYDKTTNQYTLNSLNPEGGREDLDYSKDAPSVSTSFYYEASLNYNRTFKEKHNITGLLVGVMRNYKRANAATLQESLPSRNLGLSGRFTYAYDNRYFTEVNFGYNGSERFSKKERFGFFPSIGVGWMVSNENFWMNKPISDYVTKLKLKGTYGLVGNDNIGSASDRFYYLSEVNLRGNASKYGWGENFENHPLTIAMKRYPNEQITWEVARKMNIGAEIGLFNTFDIQVDYFTEYRKNIFGVRNTIPAEMGFNVGLSANKGEASSHGLEVQLDGNYAFAKDWWLGVRGNFTYATSKYEKVEEPYRPYEWLKFEGKKINQQYGLIAERLFVDEADIANSPKQSFGEYLPGDIKYRDINNDEVINDEDVVPIGHPSVPEIVYGFGFSVGYKQFDVSCFFQGSGRTSFFINSKATNPFMSIQIDNDSRRNVNGMLQAYADSYWSETNRNIYAEFPRLSTYDVSNNNRNSTWWLRDGSYLRLKSVEVGYTLPKKVTRKWRVQGLRIYASGLNLCSWSRFKLWDVEQGNDGLQYPIQAVYNLGINLNF